MTIPLLNLQRGCLFSFCLATSQIVVMNIFFRFSFAGKDTNKRARNKKLIPLFFTAKESILEIFLKDTE